jgi:hypothetical protein
MRIGGNSASIAAMRKEETFCAAVETGEGLCHHLVLREEESSFVPLLLCDSPNPRNAAQALGPLSACHLGPVLDDIAVNHDALHDGRRYAVLTRRRRGMTGLGPRPRQPDGINCLVPIVSHLSAQRCTPQTRG